MGPRPIAWVAGIGLVIAVYSVGSALYEYATDPPGFEAVFNDDGTREACLTGDLNDVLAAWGAGGGTPRRFRGTAPGPPAAVARALGRGGGWRGGAAQANFVARQRTSPRSAPFPAPPR